MLTPTLLLLSAAIATPSLSSDPIEFDFGTITDMPHLWTWTARNTGDAPLTITAPGCDCRSAGFELPKEPIAPGQSGAIKFDLHLTSRDYGPGAKSLQLQTTDPERSSFTLVARWNYEPPVICVPPDVRFNNLAAGVPGEAYITILSHDPDFTIDSITTTASTVSFEKTDDNLPSDRERYPGRQVWRARITGETPTGLIEAPLTIRAHAKPSKDAAPVEQLVEGHVAANIRSQLTITPRLFRINPATPGATIESTITINTPDNKPFKITKAVITDCSLEGFTITSEPTESEGTSAQRLTLTGPAGTTPGLYRGTVEFTTDVPHESPITIPFNVMVKPPR